MSTSRDQERPAASADCSPYLKPGDAFYEPAEVRVARFDNEGDVPARFAAFYLLEREDQGLIRVPEKWRRLQECALNRR